MSASLSPSPNTTVVRYWYSSLTTPGSVYDYDMVTRDKVLIKRDEVVGDFDADRYVTERLTAPARDGRPVPISLVYRKGLERDGNHPLLLYGYGSYGSTTDTYFNSARLSLLDRGFVYAARDRFGFHPLTIGRREHADGIDNIVASETCALDGLLASMPPEV